MATQWLLNPLLSRHTKSTATCGTDSCERNPKTDRFLHIRWMRKKTLHRNGRRDWDNLTINLIPDMATHNQEGTHNAELFPKMWRLWTPYLAPQLLRPAPERWAFKTSSFESLGAYPRETTRLTETVLEGLTQIHLATPQGTTNAEAVNWK